jgi:hypothetical protein
LYLKYCWNHKPNHLKPYENIKINCSLLFFSIMWYIQCFVLVKNTFELNQTTGQLYCVKQLDRENIDHYIFYIRAVTSSNRRKRSFGGMLNIFFPDVYVLINMGVLKESTNLFLSGLTYKYKFIHIILLNQRGTKSDQIIGDYMYINITYYKTKKQQKEKVKSLNNIMCSIHTLI